MRYNNISINPASARRDAMSRFPNASWWENARYFALDGQGRRWVIHRSNKSRIFEATCIQKDTLHLFSATLRELSERLSWY